jgi:beta-1,4-mannosyltransferase
MIAERTLVSRRRRKRARRWGVGNIGKSGDRRIVACLSVAPWNPYLRLLYGHLAAYGFEVIGQPPFSLLWLWRARSSVTFLHFHWPESYYRYARGWPSLRPVLSRVKLALFALRLATARLLGYRLVWTVHQVYPHELVDPALDRRAARLLGRACHLLVAHDQATAAQVRSKLALQLGPDRLAVVPHGSYIGVYPNGRARDVVRDELGLPENSFVFLCFGELRAYKEIDLLLRAFSTVSLPNARLVVAGNPKDPNVASAAQDAAALDDRIAILPGFVGEQRVAELFFAADAAVLPRSSDGTSGSLILALSMGLPVVVADVPATRELGCDCGTGWLFRAGDAVSLREALAEAAAHPPEARTRGRRALDIAERLRWPQIAGDLARLLDRLTATDRGETTFPW